jgi:hypothetical protein
MSHIFLVITALGLIAVVVMQDYRYAPLRQETISQGLNGPGHVALDVVLGLLAIGIVWAAAGSTLLEVFAGLTALGLVGVSVTNTAWRWVDGVAGHLGGHEVWHLRFTALVFAGAFAFQFAAATGALWYLTATNIAAPSAIFLLSRRQDYAEKVGVLVLCIWLVAWALR